MNDLNLLVSNALSAVRDAQQSVREGGLMPAEDAQALLQDFGDVMQGLVALAQTAPQTGDALDYANTALLQKLAAGEEAVEAQALELAEVVAPLDEQALDVADEEEAAALEQVVAEVAAPLRDTLAAWLLSNNPASLPQTDTAAGAATPELGPNLPMPQTEAQAGATAAVLRQAGLQAAQAGAQQVQPTPGPSSYEKMSAALQASVTSAGLEAQGSADTVPIAAAAQAQATSHAAPGTRQAAPSNAADALRGPNEARLAQAPVMAFDGDRADIAAQTSAPEAQNASARSQDGMASGTPSTQASAPAATQAAAHTVEGLRQPGVVESTPAAENMPAPVAPAEAETAATSAPRANRAPEAKSDSDQSASKPASAPQTARPQSTIAERRAARSVQNYQQAMSDQPATVPATPAQAPNIMTTHITPPATAPTTPSDPGTPTVQLSQVTLPQLPADLTNALAAGAKRVRIEINPPALGSVEVGVQLRDGAVFVSMQAENANVAQHIERHFQDLRTTLKEAGLSLGGFEMSSRGDTPGEHASHSGASPQDRLWSDDMLQLAVEHNVAPLAEEITHPVTIYQRPGGINVVA